MFVQLLVQYYHEEIAPFASALCTEIAAVFVRTIQESDAEDEEAQCAAAECVRTLNYVLLSCNKRPDIFEQLMPVMLPCIALCKRSPIDSC